MWVGGGERCVVAADAMSGVYCVCCGLPVVLLIVWCVCCALQVVVTDNLSVLRASTIHFGQYGLLVPVLSDPAALAIQAAEWACSQVTWDLH